MKIYPVTAPEFKPYGRIVEGYPVEGLLEALRTTPCPDDILYIPKVDVLHAAPHAEEIGEVGIDLRIQLRQRFVRRSDDCTAAFCHAGSGSHR